MQNILYSECEGSSVMECAKSGLLIIFVIVHFKADPQSDRTMRRGALNLTPSNAMEDQLARCLTPPQAKCLRVLLTDSTIYTQWSSHLSCSAVRSHFKISRMLSRTRVMDAAYIKCFFCIIKYSSK